MLRSLTGLPTLLIALSVELILIAALVQGNFVILPDPVWLLAHAMASLLAAIALASILYKLVPGKRIPLVILFFLISFFLPFIGATGTWLSLTFGSLIARSKHQVNEYWQFTDNTDLPFTAPIDRPVRKLDSRGFIEQLAFDTDTDKLYNKVAAAKNIRNTESGPALKSAVSHSNERIRLLAYQMLDKKVSALNKEIQRLEGEAERTSGAGKAGLHLQIANNYRELLTLEDDEPVARKELLIKASIHVQTALEFEPSNVNAHFVSGQLQIKQNAPEEAIAAFETSLALGMPGEKVLPYIAEAAFMQRNFEKIRNVVNEINPAFRAYPPMSKVVEYWA